MAEKVAARPKLSKAIAEGMKRCDDSETNAGEGSSNVDTKEESLSARAEHLETFCRLKDGKSCERRGLIAEENRRKKEAEKFYSKGCKLKHVGSCERYRPFVDQACVQGDAKMCYLSATIYLYRLREKNLVKATHAYGRACSLGIEQTCEYALDGYLEDASTLPDDKTLFKHVKRVCSSTAKHCVTLAMRYEKGDVFPKDPVKAFALYKQGCDQRRDESCMGLGHAYEAGVGVPKDKIQALLLQLESCNACDRYAAQAKAICSSDTPKLCNFVAKKFDTPELYSKSCASNNAIGCQNWATALFSDRNDPQPKKALKIFKKACRLGSADSCSFIGEYYESFELSLHEGLAFYHKGCALKSGEDCLQAGLRSRAVLGDNVKATAAFEAGCALNQAEACFHFATHLEKSPRTRRNAKRALAAFRRSCDHHGPDEACVAAGKALFMLGDKSPQYSDAGEYLRKGRTYSSMHLYGLFLRSGKNANLERSKFYLEQACGSDYAPSCVQLGKDNTTEIFGYKDLGVAAFFFQKSCENKAPDGEGCFLLAEAHEKGLGLTKSNAKAKHYYQKSCSLKFKAGCSKK